LNEILLKAEGSAAVTILGSIKIVPQNGGSLQKL
jgi:hypothetical protein